MGWIIATIAMGSLAMVMVVVAIMNHKKATLVKKEAQDLLIGIHIGLTKANSRSLTNLSKKGVLPDTNSFKSQSAISRFRRDVISSSYARDFYYDGDIQPIVDGIFYLLHIRDLESNYRNSEDEAQSSDSHSNGFDLEPVAQSSDTEPLVSNTIEPIAAVAASAIAYESHSGHSNHGNSGGYDGGGSDCSGGGGDGGGGGGCD